MTGTSPLGSVDKALRAMQRLGDAGAGGLGLTELARDLGLNKASLHRTLLALRHRGFVEQDENSNYRLGPAFLAVADSFMRDESLRSLLHDALAQFSTLINETCHMGVLTGEQIVYIEKVESQRATRIWSEIGWRNPAVTTALGRAILSQKFVDFSSFSAAFPSGVPRRTSYTRRSMRAVWQELLDARKRGYAKEEQENELGITCVGIAILRGQNVIAALSITAPSDRMDAKRMAMLIRKLRDHLASRLPPGLVLQKPLPDDVARPRRKAGT